MAAAPKRVTKTTVTTPVKGGGTKRVSTTTTRQGGNVTTTKTTTVSGPKKATKPKKAAPAKKTASKKASKPAKLARPQLTGEWICGPNEKYALCGAVAVANTLLAATGVRASSGDIERLYRAAGGRGDSGVPVPELLAAASVTGLAGCRLAVFGLCGADDEAARLLLLTLAGLGDLHAAAVAGGDLITWGEAVPLASLPVTVECAWSMTWHGEEADAHG
jgi:hypothetical protein